MTRQYIRSIIILAILSGAIFVTGYRLSHPAPDIMTTADDEAVTVTETRSLVAQATTVEDMVPTPAEQMVVYNNQMFDYHLDYPVGWQINQTTANVSQFESPDGVSRVTVEAIGSLPAEGLAAFVARNLGEQMVISHQTLTIHSQPAERVIVYAEDLGAQETNFFIETDASLVIITGVGEQKPIEMIARSFNAPQAVAQR